MEGHLLFNKAVTKWKKKKANPHPQNTLMGITDNRNVEQGSYTAVIGKMCLLSESNRKLCFKMQAR